MDTLVDTDVLSNNEVTLDNGSVLDGWEGKPRSPELDCNIWSFVASRGLAKSLELKQANDRYTDSDNIIGIQNLPFDYYTQNQCRPKVSKSC